jgi:membrane protein DedA with SNARE-associated domain
MLRMFSALLAGANGMPTARFLLFNVAGGICFGAIALGAEIYKISETLSVISLGLLIAAGYAFPIFVRRNEAALHRRAVEVLRDHLRG